MAAVLQCCSVTPVSRDVTLLRDRHPVTPTVTHNNMTRPMPGRSGQGSTQTKLQFYSETHSIMQRYCKMSFHFPPKTCLNSPCYILHCTCLGLPPDVPVSVYQQRTVCCMLPTSPTPHMVPTSGHWSQGRNKGEKWAAVNQTTGPILISGIIPSQCHTHTFHTQCASHNFIS